MGWILTDLVREGERRVWMRIFGIGKGAFVASWNAVSGRGDGEGRSVASSVGCYAGGCLFVNKVDT